MYEDGRPTTYLDVLVLSRATELSNSESDIQQNTPASTCKAKSLDNAEGHFQGVLEEMLRALGE
jgi:hypothetical protein